MYYSNTRADQKFCFSSIILATEFKKNNDIHSIHKKKKKDQKKKQWHSWLRQLKSGHLFPSLQNIELSEKNVFLLPWTVQKSGL